MPRAKADRGKLKSIGDAVDRLKGWAPAREVLTPVEAVPTVFPQMDAATRVGGWPLQRIGLLHGPSNHGKTLLMLGIGRSFLEAGGFFFYVDAEMTTPMPWVEQLLGASAQSDRFLAKRPTTFEETAKDVRSAIEMVTAAREHGLIGEDVSAVIGIDSIRKLVPKRLREALEASSQKDGLDGMRGRAAQYKAALNAAWMDELVPLLYHSRTSLVMIARESENTEAGMYDDDFKVGGGKSLVYDSSLVIRVERASWIKNDDESGVVGERLRGTIRKTKIAGKDERMPRFYFHTSNGTESPEGLDRARDVLEAAQSCDVITVAGSMYRYSDQSWRGKAAMLNALRADPALLSDIEANTRQAYEPPLAEDDPE